MEYRKIKIRNFDRPVMFTLYRRKWLVFSVPFNPFNVIDFFEKHIRYINGVRTIASARVYDDQTGFVILSVFPNSDFDRLFSDIHESTHNYFNA